MSDRFTVRSFVSPCTLIVALAAFSSIATIVASTTDPLIVTLTLSPVFNAAAADAGTVASGEGLGTGVAVDCATGLGAGFVTSAAGSQAEIRTHKASTARSFVVMLLAPVDELFSYPAGYCCRILNSRVNDGGRRNVSVGWKFFLSESDFVVGDTAELVASAEAGH